jgi:hypothetical protein
MSAQPTTIGTTRHGRLPRQWFRTVLRNYRRRSGPLWMLCENSETFRLAWEDGPSHDYLRKLAIRFCTRHEPNFYVGIAVLFRASSPTTNDEHVAVRTAFLRWCIASTANRTA